MTSAWLSPAGASKALDVSERTLRDWAGQGKIARKKIGRQSLYRVDSGKPTTAIAAIAADPAFVPAGDRFAELAEYVDDLLDRAQTFEDRVTDLTTELETERENWSELDNKLDDLTRELETERDSSAELADKVEEWSTSSKRNGPLCQGSCR